MGALLELRGLLKHLQWYGEVNRRGFIKITKKLDKKVGQKATQKRYLENKVDPKQFATNVDLFETKASVNEWISKLAEVKIRDDASSIHSTHSLQRVTPRTLSSIPASLLDGIDSAVRTDDAPALAERLSRVVVTENEAGEDFQRTLCLTLLQRAVSSRAKRCTRELLSRLPSLDEIDDINKRNCIHRLIITAGRLHSLDHQQLGLLPPSDELGRAASYIKPASAPMSSAEISAKRNPNGTEGGAKEDDIVDFLEYLFSYLKPEHQSAIRSRDVYGRTPLHYAAHFGFVTVCTILIVRMQDWEEYEDSSGISAPFWQDVDGLTPIHLSVIGGHPLTTKQLLEAKSREINTFERATIKSMTNLSELLALAVKASHTVIVKLLVEAGVDLDFQDDQGETALYVAARTGHADSASILILGNALQKADIETPENSFGWTPLHVACVEGHLAIVKLLIEAGADLEKADGSGWTAKEHATLRGHMDIAYALDHLTTTTFSQTSTMASTAASNGTSHKSVADWKSPTMANGKENGSIQSSEPVKSFGHRYLTKDSIILVSLGTMDNRKQVDPISLDHIPLANAHSTQLDTALSVIVSAQGATGEPSIVDLPVQENISTEPIVFSAVDALKVKLLFDIVPTYAGSSKEIVGRGVALLSSIKPSLGSKRINLQGDVCVPIVAADTLEVIGCVNFNFLIITPFSHPNMTISSDRTYWKRMASTMVIGHRGLGKNVASRGSLQLGENTIQSFIAAANLGASYVEFDVQLTKDLVPVIYHDFLVSETGIDAPVHSLTLEQFLHINDPRIPRNPPSAGQPHLADLKSEVETRKHRSSSLGDAHRDESTTNEQSERMKNTRDFKAKGFKANTRGNFIQGAFTTLEEMFRLLPESTGFNIEMKYPMLYETEEQDMDTFAVELNTFVDAVLTKVYDWGGTKNRNIIFSSFNPDICLLLSFKQPSIPVLFLTDAGTSPVGDIRAGSLQEAIRFASRWNLLGIVSAATPLVISPRLVRVVKESGLVCVSYGGLNNDSDKVQVSLFLFRSFLLRKRGPVIKGRC